MFRHINMGLLVLLLPTVSMAGPTAKELLGKFTETADKTHTSFITKSKTVMKLDNNYSGEWAYLNGEKTKYILQEFRTDGERMKRIRYMWGEFATPDGDIVRPESDKTYVSETYNGDKRYQYARPHDSAGNVIVELKGPGKIWTIDKRLAHGNNISECFGYLEGDVERFDRILKRAGTGQVSVRDEMEDVNGTAHYVIDAKTRNGQYTIWLNPEKGHNFSKAVVVREPGDLVKGRYEVEPGGKNRYYIETTQFIDVNGVWVPAKAKMRVHDTLPNGDQVKHTKDVELISILIDPDHDTLDSFSIDDIKDGAMVYYKDGPPGWYIWRDGKAVAKIDKLVIAELDKKAEEIMAEKAEGSTANDSIGKASNVESKFQIEPGTGAASLFIPKVYSAQKQGKPFVLDLATAQLLAVPWTLDTKETDERLLKVAKGDIAWNGSLVAVRQAKITNVLKKTQPPLKSTPGKWCSYYHLSKKAKLPYTFIVTNKEGHRYLMRILKVRTDGIEVGYNKLVLVADEDKSEIPIEGKSK